MKTSLAIALLLAFLADHRPIHPSQACPAGRMASQPAATRQRCLPVQPLSSQRLGPVRGNPQLRR